MKLTRWDTEETIHESKHVTIKECVEDAIKQGVSLYRIDLKCANLTDADLRCANLTDADLRYADLRRADLRYADLRRANLRCAGLRYANLRFANLTGTDLRDADLRCADLNYSSWPIWCGSCRVTLDKENNEWFAYQAMINMDQKVLAEFLQNPVEFANRFAGRKGIRKIKAGKE